jgi:hypothetical protein
MLASSVWVLAGTGHSRFQNRLRGMDYSSDTVQRPRYFGLLTNDVVYDRLAPGVLEELKRVNPKDEVGRRKHRHFQWLTSNKGYPKLREHLGAVVATMRLSGDWHDFMTKLDKYYPRQGKPTQLSFDCHSTIAPKKQATTARACEAAN